MSWKRGWVYTADTPSGARPDNELPGGGYVDNELPGMGGGAHPDNELPGGGGHIWGTLIRWLMRPQVGGGPIKPPGLWPILPVDPGWGVDPPDGPPHGPGDWIPIDPGFGKPPIWGFLPVDPGWGVGAPNPPRPDNELPGHWVPVDPGFGKPGRPCGERPAHIWGQRPLWAWIAEIGPDFGLPLPGTPPDTAEPK